MVSRLVSGVSDKLCANCYGGGITKMEKLPHLNEVYLCPVCSGTQYYLPGEGVEDQQPIEEEAL